MCVCVCGFAVAPFGVRLQCVCGALCSSLFLKSQQKEEEAHHLASLRVAYMFRFAFNLAAFGWNCRLLVNSLTNMENTRNKTPTQKIEKRNAHDTVTVGSHMREEEEKGKNLCMLSLDFEKVISHQPRAFFFTALTCGIGFGLLWDVNYLGGRRRKKNEYL